MRNRRRTNILLALTFFIIFLFELIVVIYSDSYELTLEEQRKQIYGSWHLSVHDVGENTLGKIAGHATVDNIGHMEIEGLVVDYENDDVPNIVGGIGCVDSTAIKNGNISLLDGEFPSKKGEIAIEAAMLLRMGYSYELGQEIKLTITKENKKNERIEHIENFTLSGVIKNYSAYWKLDNNWALSFFVHPDTFTEDTKSIDYIFIELRSEFTEEADALSLLLEKGEHYTKNEYTYLEYGEENTPLMNNIIFRLITLLTGCTSIAMLINNDIYKRRKSFIIMRTLGAEKSQIIRLYMGEKLKVIIVPSIIGILTGLLIPYVVYHFIKTRVEATSPFYLDYNFSNLVQMIIIMIVTISISFLISIISLFRVPLRGLPQQQVAVQHLPKSKRKLTFRNLPKIIRLTSPTQRAISVFLTFIITFFIIVTAYATWTDYKEFTQFKERYPADYSYGLLTMNHASQTMASKEELMAIQNAYGVKEVQTFSCSDYYPITFSESYDIEYAKIIQEYLQEREVDISESDVKGSVIGISDNLVNYYTSTLDNNEVVLYLPDFYEDQGHLLISKDGTNQMKKVSEHMIHIGDYVEIDIWGNIEKLKIVEIIRAFDEHLPYDIDPMRPYSLICNENTYSRLMGETEYSYIMVYNDATAIQYQTDMELSKIETDLFFNNNRVERANQLGDLYANTVYSLILCCLVFVLTIVIRVIIISMDEKRKMEKWQLLYKLGMSKSRALLEFVKGAVNDGILGTFIAFAGFIMYRIWEEHLMLLQFSDYQFSGLIQHLKEAFERSIIYTDWKVALIVAIVIGVINIVVLILYDYSYIGQKGLDNLNK